MHISSKYQLIQEELGQTVNSHTFLRGIYQAPEWKIRQRSTIVTVNLRKTHSLLLDHPLQRLLLLHHQPSLSVSIWKEMEMDSISKKNDDFPILSYLLSQTDPNSQQFDQNLSAHFPYLNYPKVLSSLTQAIPSSATNIFLLLKSLGPRPNPDVVSMARSNLTQMQEPGKTEIYKAVLKLEEMHEEYGRQLKEVEEMLVGVYKDVVVREIESGEQVDEEVVAILREAESGGAVGRVNLSARQLRLIPESIGRLHGLLVLNLSQNQLEVS